MYRLFTSLLAFATCVSLCAQDPSTYLQIDQFGYLPNAEKVAVLTNPRIGQNAGGSFTPGATIEIRRVNDDGVVWSGSPAAWNNGATHATSGDQGWWVDFSDLTTDGEYYLIDVASGERTGPFEIGNNVYESVLADAGRAFFYNRCNAPKAAPYAEAGWTDGTNFENPLQDTECSYLYDRENAALRRDLSGGWFDAGDYNKYVTFAQPAVEPLLWAYRESPAAFTDTWNIPESGNGIPDLLDELKWELDWLRKMVNADGSVIIKMGSISHSENVSAPPSANTDRRYYGPVCTSASIAASSMLAHAALVFGEVPAWSDFVTDISTEAEATFAYWLARSNAGTLEYNCDDGTIKAGDADRTDQEQREIALTAAAHLFELTGNVQYNDYVRDHLTDAEYVNSNWWGPYKNEFTTAMVRHMELPDAHPTAVTALRSSMTGIVRDDWNGFYGFNDEDLYRAFMPEWSYHWGSNSIASRYGNLNRVMARANLVAGNEADLNRKADGMVHYLHGVNPLGLVYLSAMQGRGAERSSLEIYHTWFNDGTDWDNAETSLYGPAPGFVPGGPNKDFTIGSISPPSGEPPMKSFLDWNGGFPENSWEITEPAIYYQAAYIRNLAAMMTTDALLPVSYLAPLWARQQAKSVLLEWRVSSEPDADFYAVEHLAKDGNWKEIGRVAARGLDRYVFVHEAPRTGTNEYRLRQADLDGRTTYTPVATVFFRDRYAQIRFFPNPLPRGTELQLEEVPYGAELLLHDAAGRRVYQAVVYSSRTRVSTEGLPPGIYSVELLSGAEGVVWAGRVFIE